MKAQLNKLLATTAVFYQNLRTYHWYVKGPKFFKLHEKFEEIYDEAAGNLDEIAERILALDANPLYKYSDFVSNSAIEETNQTTGDIEMVNEVVNQLGVILKLEKEILTLAGNDNDESTSTLMSDLIVAQEKHLWMLKAYLG